MATFLQDFISSTEAKWQEVDLLILKAKDVQDTDPNFYSVLCRAITILLVAHLEGFIKDLVKSIIKDLNRNCTFSTLPDAIKRTYCKKYLGYNFEGKIKAYERKIDTLIHKFEEVNCQISDEPFLFENRNPKADVIQQTFDGFGISNIFEHLYKSDFEDVFSWSLLEIQAQIEILQKYILKGAEDFPYKIDMKKFKLIEKKKKIPNTLWEAFLEQVNQNRHSVAHGNIFENITNIVELEQSKLKIIIIQFALVTILASTIALKTTTRE